MTCSAARNISTALNFNVVPSSLCGPYFNTDFMKTAGSAEQVRIFSAHVQSAASTQAVPTKQHPSVRVSAEQYAIGQRNTAEERQENKGQNDLPFRFQDLNGANAGHFLLDPHYEAHLSLLRREARLAPDCPASRRWLKKRA